MKLRKKLYTPVWRDPKHRPEGKSRYILGILSAICLALLLIPPRKGYDQPISLQLSDGEGAAWVCFVGMGLTIAYFAIRLWSKEEKFTAFACGSLCIGLGVIATTDPFSANHLAVFAFIVLFLVGWQLTIYLMHEDARLYALAILSTIAVFLCPFMLGIAERALVITSATAMNLVFYDYMVY